MAKTVNPTYVSGHFKFRLDDAGWTATDIAAEDTAISRAVDTTFRLLFGWGESAGQTVSDAEVATLQYQLNGGGYANVTAATPVKLVSSSFLTDGDTDTTQRLTVPTGVAAYASSEYDNNNTVASQTLVDQCVELEYTLQLDSAQVNNGDVIQFQFVLDADTFSSADTTPQVTAVAAATASPSAGLTLFNGYAPTAQVDVINITTPSVGIVNLLGELATMGVDTGAVEVLPSAGAFSFSGGAPLTSKEQAVSPAAGLVSFLGGITNVEAGVYNEAQPTLGTVSFTGHAPTITKENGLHPAVGTLGLSGYTPGFESVLLVELLPAAGLAVFTGATVSALMEWPHTVSPLSGVVSTTGETAIAAAPFDGTVNPSAGVLDITSYTPSIAVTVKLVPTTGTMSYTSGQPVVTHGFWVFPSACVISLTRYTAAINLDRWVPQPEVTGLWTSVTSKKRRGYRSN